MNLPRIALSLPMQENDADARTVREYLLALVDAVWVEDEGFSGKRPFGNSGWKHEVYQTLTDAGLVSNDGDGYDLIRSAIKELR